MISKIKFWLVALLILCVAVFVAAGTWLYYYSITPIRSLDTVVQFNLAKGSSLQGVAKQLVSENILDEPWGFNVLGRIYGKSGQIKAGNFELKGEITPLGLLNKITGNDYAQESIVFIEGWTFKQMRKTLDGDKSINHATRGLSDVEILQQIAPTYTNPEGLFYPDTYFFTAGTSDIKILERAHSLMQTHLQQRWAQRSPGLPYASPYEALIAASIVEKETGLISEMPMVSAVVINRLRLRMKLQADPTVIYGMGDQFDGNLRKIDLLTDHVYNTYTRSGLPPTPIAMPSLAAIDATLNPAKTNALYYVGRGDGSSYFSSTLDEHNRAVAKYQKSRRN
jgi:UPF0755 protein